MEIKDFKLQMLLKYNFTVYNLALSILFIKSTTQISSNRNLGYFLFTHISTSFSYYSLMLNSLFFHPILYIIIHFIYTYKSANLKISIIYTTANINKKGLIYSSKLNILINLCNIIITLT